MLNSWQETRRASVAAELTVTFDAGARCDVQFITQLSALSQADAMEL